MDLLINLIIEIIEGLTKGTPKKAKPQSGEAVEQQRLATEQRIREMQAAIAQQKARAKPTRKRGPSRGAPIAPQAKAVPQAPDAYTAPLSQTAAPSTIASKQGRAPLRELRIPFILGEILAPPLALREPEF